MIDVPRGQPHSPHTGGFPEMQRGFEQMNINAHPPFEHNDNNIHNPQNLGFDIHPGLHGHGSTGEGFHGLGSPSAGYEGCIITRKRIPGQEKIWAIVDREEWRLTQDQFKSEVRKDKSGGKDVYNRVDMKGRKRQQIDRLIHDRTLDNPDCKYKLASLKLETSWDGKVVRAMRVILKREPLSGNTTFRTRSVNGETVDLTGAHIHNDLGSSYGSSSGYLHASSPPHRLFVPQMNQTFPEPIPPHAPRAEPWVHINRPDIQGPPHPGHHFEHLSPGFDQPQDNSPRPDAGFDGPLPQFQQPHHDGQFQTDSFLEGHHHPDSGLKAKNKSGNNNGDDRHQPGPFFEGHPHPDSSPNAKNKSKNDKSNVRRQPSQHFEGHSHPDSNPKAKNKSKMDQGGDKHSKKNNAKNYNDFPSRSESDGYEDVSDYSGFSKTKSNRTRDTDLSDEEYYKEKRYSAKHEGNRRDSYSSRDPYHDSAERIDRRHSHRLGRKDSRRSSRSSHEYDRDSHGAFRQHRRKSPHHSANSSQSSGTRYYIDDYEYIPSKSSRHERANPFRHGLSFSQEPRPYLSHRPSSFEEEARGTRRSTGFKGNQMPSFSHPIDVHDDRADLVEQITNKVAQKLRTDGLEKENDDLRRQMMMEKGHMGPRAVPGYMEPQYADQHFPDLPYTEPRYNRRLSRTLQRGGMYGGVI